MALEVGTVTKAYCSKCKEIGDHDVLAVKSARSATARCKTCNDEHAHRKTRPRAKARNAKPAVPQPTEWEVEVAPRDASEAVAYAISGAFERDQLLSHKRFGVGLIQRVMSDKTMDVLFEPGIKTLIHSR
jgi:hypothetical protein